jgi:hypothetical protein
MWGCHRPDRSRVCLSQVAGFCFLRVTDTNGDGEYATRLTHVSGKGVLLQTVLKPDSELYVLQGGRPFLCQIVGRLVMLRMLLRMP